MQNLNGGKVYLVGAGPGDPGLLTLKGLECLKKAEVVVCDYLANQELLARVKDGTKIIYAGKKAGKHALPQEQINQLLVDKAKEGKIVVRLKGGDPFVFGRGGEEAEFLVDNGVEFEVVPGVTSAVAVPAYAGIPLTHRKYTSITTIITGHEDMSKGNSSLPWPEIAKLGGTIVVLMGTSNLGQIVEELMNNGCSPQTPVAVIRWGTLNEQETIIATLSDIIEKAAEIKPPAISVIGQVVNLRQKLNWFEKKPLFGQKILVTRTRVQASGLSQLLKEYGACVKEFPLIKIAPPTNFDGLDRAIEKLAAFDWIVFTSVNGVGCFFNRLKQQGKDVRELKGVRIGAIGPKTSQTIKDMGLCIDAQPENEYQAESMANALKGWGMKGKKVLIPRAQEAREVLLEELKKMGAEVEVVAAYQTLKEDSSSTDLSRILREVDLITFTSSSTVTNFVARFKPEELPELLYGIKIASIGPITSKTAAELGLKVDITAQEYTIEGLVKAIIAYPGRTGASCS